MHIHPFIHVYAVYMYVSGHEPSKQLPITIQHKNIYNHFIVQKNLYYYNIHIHMVPPVIT